MNIFQAVIAIVMCWTPGIAKVLMIAIYWGYCWHFACEMREWRRKERTFEYAFDEIGEASAPERAGPTQEQADSPGSEEV